MPLYDFQCIECEKVEEKLFPKAIDFMLYQKYLEEYIEELDVIPGYTVIHTDLYLHYCECGQPQQVYTPLPSMQPDSMWAGTDTRMGYFTSKSKYERTLKDRNIVTVDKKELDKINKNVYNVKQDKIKKQINNLNSFVEKELASVEISPDGNTVKEKNKYARKRQ